MVSNTGLLVSLIVVSLSCAADFQRPWDNATWLAENPGMWGSAVWWNVPELDRTLDGLGLHSVNQLGLNGSAKTYAEAALQDKNGAKNAFGSCVSAITPGVLARMALAASGPLGLGAAMMANFSLVPDCRSYPDFWKGAVGGSLSSLEASMAAAENSIASARAAHTEMSRMGLCNVSYAGPGSGPCAEMQSAFAAVEGNTTSGKYGKYQLVLDYAMQLRAGLLLDTPALAHYAPMMMLIWGSNGTLDSFDGLGRMGEKAMADAETGFVSLRSTGASRKGMAESGLQEAKGQKLNRISRAPAGFEARGTGTVSERFAEAEARSTRLSHVMKEAENLHASRLTDGYLANSISMMAWTADGYAGLIAELDAMMEEARTATELQEQDAEFELGLAGEFVKSGARSTESVALYGEAKAYLAKGDGSAALGDRFDAYYKAAARARECRNARGQEEEAEIGVMLAELGQLIADAEKDGINVASEKATLGLLSGLSASDIGDSVQFSIDSIIAKAKLRYGDDLADTRTRLLDKLSLAGPDAADLYTDLRGYEDGIVAEDGLIGWRDSIGKLKALKQDYAGLEAALDMYMGEVVGNAMSVSVSPLIEGACLDAPAAIILDAVLANDRNYAAGNVSARISMPAPVQFVYSDVTGGKGGVQSLRMADGGKTVVLALGAVGPFESRHVILTKQSIVGRTIKRETSAHGTGGGAASVSDRLEFELDTAVSSLRLPGGFENAPVDGSRPGPLAPGKHMATAKYAVDDAYDEERNDFMAYPIGTNSRVEYDLEIMPHMDLDDVAVFLDIRNDSRVSSLEVVAATGELVRDRKRVSETQFTATVTGLQKDRRTVLKVSYMVEDTEALVRTRMVRLETMNLSAEGRVLLGQAMLQLEGGNYTKALELIEKAEGVTRNQEAEDAKLQKKYDQLSTELAAELEELDAALGDAALGTNATGPFIDRLSARKAELDRVRQEAGGLNLSSALRLLEGVDFGWMGNELGTFRKDSYKEYNSLKERLFKAGNSGTPVEFLEFEGALNRLETGGRLGYAVQAARALQKVKTLVEAEEAKAKTANDALRASFGLLKSEVLGVQERYLKESGVAKGTEYDGYFTETAATLAKKIKDAEVSLGGDARIAAIKMGELNGTKEKMLQALEELKGEAGAKLALVESLFGKSGLDGSTRDGISGKIETMRIMINSGEYVNALLAGSAIAKELDASGKKDNNGILLLGLTALAVLSTVVVYMVKQQEGGGYPGHKKPLRKLQKAWEAQDVQKQAGEKQDREGQAVEKRDRETQAGNRPEEKPDEFSGDAPGGAPGKKSDG